MAVLPDCFSGTDSGEKVLRTKREAETEEERKERLERAVKKAAAAEDALDMMVRRSIKLHGP
jgi:hypothetical protein